MQCQFTDFKDNPCRAHAVTGRKYCFFHSKVKEEPSGYIKDHPGAFDRLVSRPKPKKTSPNTGNPKPTVKIDPEKFMTDTEWYASDEYKLSKARRTS